MVKPGFYVPVRGDILWIDFSPQLGHEQRGRRPALVISHESYNKKTGLALFCPVTSKVKGYPFEVAVTGKKIQGCVLSDQVKSLEWTVRNTEFIEKLDADSMKEVVERVRVLIT